MHTESEEFIANIELGSASQGEVRTDMEIWEQDGQTVTQFNYSNVLLVVEPGGAISTTNAAEYLHAATTPLIDAHLNTLKQDGTSIEEDLKSFNRARLLNEFVVHGYEFVWGRSYKDENPDKDKIILGGGRGSAWQDNPNVKLMSNFIENKGPEYVFRLYQTDPEKLIVESGVNMG